MLESATVTVGMWIARIVSNPSRGVDMRMLAIGAFAAMCWLGWIEACAQAANVAPANPPRTQQEIMQERRAACRDLRGAEFRECMNNYVGTRDKSKSLDSESDKRADKPDPLPPTDPQPKPDAPGHSDPKK